MTRQARTPPTTESLVANSRHLFYEIAMFGQTTRLLRTTPWADELPLDDKIRLSALIESRLTHARSLMRFLYPPERTRHTDMFAFDYLTDSSVLPAKWVDFDRDLDRIDKEIAHLTYLRPPEPTHWPLADENLTPCLVTFIEHVAEDRVQPNFKREASESLHLQHTWGPAGSAPATASTSTPQPPTVVFQTPQPPTVATQTPQPFG